MEIDSLTSSVCFDDILLVPKYSKVSSRSLISLSTKIGNMGNPDAWIELDSPIVMAPMESISSNLMIEKVIDFGGIAFVHRHQTTNNRIFQLDVLSKSVKDISRLGFSINMLEAQDNDFMQKILSYGTKIILIDTAFGHIEDVLETVSMLRSRVPRNVHIMSGNISSYEAYNDLMSAGSDSVRVGIGGGASCTTRIATGFGVPVLSSIIDVFEKIKNDEVNGLISDGGIKNNGDIVKALAGGASAVMMGSIFAGHDECDKTDDGRFVFRGTASESLQKELISSVPKEMYIEGAEGFIDPRGSVETTISLMLNNIKSGLAYSGSSNLKDFRKNAKFIKVSPLSIRESESRV